jgi:ATP-binding cassette subfamily C (CFTR/MRP) protein 1
VRFRRAVLYRKLTPIAYVPLFISPVVTFGMYMIIEKDGGSILNISRMFTSYSLILLLTQPLASLFQAVPTIISAVGCFSRIQEFLLATPRVDTRKVVHRSEKANNVAAELVRIDAKAEKLESFEYQNANPTSNSMVADVSAAILVRDATFSWTEQDTQHFELRNINLQIQQATLTMIVGPVASGKSTLLKALLGEVPHCNGSTWLSSGDIAFCDQTPWLLNSSVQKNILAFEELDRSWYNTVIQACGLENDIVTFPNGDQTIIGSSGMTLSGGQKQRVVRLRYQTLSYCS